MPPGRAGAPPPWIGKGPGTAPPEEWMKTLRNIMIVALCALPYSAQAGISDGGAWAEFAVGMNAVVKPTFQYQPTMKFRLGLDRILLDAQFGFNQALEIDSSLLQTVGIGAELRVWSGGIPFVKGDLDRLHVLAIGTARSEAGSTKIDFTNGDIGIALRPDFNPDNKVMLEGRMTWLYADEQIKHMAFGADVVFEF